MLLDDNTSEIEIANEGGALVQRVNGGAPSALGGGAGFPDGTAALPGAFFTSTPGDGMYRTASILGFARAGVQVGGFDAFGFFLAGGTSRYELTDGGIQRINPNGDIQITTVHDIVFGASAALATNATSGFIQIPTCAGTPTGTVAIITGKACLVYDTTNFKLGLSVGGGVWKQTAALT